MRVLYIEPVGGHRGMHYYDFALCGALWELGVEPILATCDETECYAASLPYQIFYPFRGIYGEKNLLIRGFNYLRALWQILQEAPVRRVRIAHLHYFHLPLADYAFVSLLKRRGLKIVITAHDVVPFTAGFLSKWIVGWIYRVADKVVVHAHSNREAISSTFGVPKEKAEVIPMGPYFDLHLNTSLDREAARGQLGIPAHKEVILFFGQIKRVKGLDHLIRAFQIVGSKRPDSLLLIVGPIWKDDFSRYEDLTDELGLKDRVISRPEYVSDEELTLYFSAADLVVLPYTKAYQSAVLFMAYTFSRPVVVSAVGGLAEVVKDGETGYLVPPADEARLAEAIEKILVDKGRAEEMGNAAGEMVKANYSWQKIAAETKKVYEALLAQKGFEEAGGG